MGTPAERNLTDLSYSPCNLCPRCCGTLRDEAAETGPYSPVGFCGETADVRVAAALLHFGEEPPLTGSGGSGTVFFTGCTLRCSFCQNQQISLAGMGRRVSTEALADIMLRLEDAGAENINLVTGTHFLPGILATWRRARGRGLDLPVVWNSSGYETVPAVEALAEMTDIFLPDVKTVDSGTAGAEFGTPGYADAVTKAVERMVELKPVHWYGTTQDPRASEEADARRPLLSGTIVRHLVLPGKLDNTRRVLEWFAESCADKALLSLMFQYVPVREPLGTGISSGEYRRILGLLDEFGIEEGYVQELDDDRSWLPDFDKVMSFPSPDVRMVWHWRAGFV